MASNVVAKEGYPPKTNMSMEHPQLEDVFRIQTRFFQLVMLASRGAIAKNLHSIFTHVGQIASLQAF